MSHPQRTTARRFVIRRRINDSKSHLGLMSILVLLNVSQSMLRTASQSSPMDNNTRKYGHTAFIDFFT
jgi:hypothetical protein